MAIDYDAAPAKERYQRWIRSNRRNRIRRTRRAATKAAGRTVRLQSGGPKRDRSLEPIVARLRDELIALAEKYGTVKEVEKVDKKAAFSAAALAALKKAYAQAWASGFQDSGLNVLDPAAAATAGITPDLLSDPENIDPADLEAAGIDPTDLGDALGDGEGDIADAVDNQSNFVDVLAGLLIAGGLTAAAIGARMDLYAASANPVYEQGFESGAGLQGDITQATWHTQEDAEVCDMCDERDGQTWQGDEEHPYPGEGYFGEVCEGGPNCRCELWYELIPAAEADVPVEGDAGDGGDAVATDEGDTGEEDISAFATGDIAKMSDRQLVAYRSLVAGLTSFAPAELAAIRGLAAKYAKKPTGRPKNGLSLAESPAGGHWAALSTQALLEAREKLTKGEWDPDLHPRGEGGRFGESGGGSDKPPSTPINKDTKAQIERLWQRVDPETKATVTKNMAAYIERSSLRIRVPGAVFRNVISEGVKNQFETKTSEGILDPKYRAEIEGRFFGLKDGAAASDRPVYGYFSNKDDPEHWASSYGSVCLRLNDDVKDRACFTSKDSLDEQSSYMPVPVTRAAEDAYLAVPATAGSIQDVVTDPVHIGGNTGYVEAQVFGGVTASDINHVVFTGNPPDFNEQQMLASLGIPWQWTGQTNEYGYYEGGNEYVRQDAIAGKLEKGGWNPDLHPRDDHGRFGEGGGGGGKEWTTPDGQHFRSVDGRTPNNQTAWHRAADEWSSRGYTKSTKDAVNANFTRYLEESSIRVRVPTDVLEKVLDDGRLKSQFETGTSGGMLDNNYRAEIESMHWFGTKEVGDGGRPIYGYFGNPKDTVGSDWYGDVVLRLKDDVKDRATFTAEDSLDKYARYAPVPVSMAATDAWRAVDPQMNAERAADPSNVDRLGARLQGYVEAQVFGGVQLSDIDHVVFTGRTPGPAVFDRLDSFGIPWSWGSDSPSSTFMDEYVRQDAPTEPKDPTLYIRTGRG